MTMNAKGQTRPEGAKHADFPYQFTVDQMAEVDRLRAANRELAEALQAVLEHGSLDPAHLHRFGAAYQKARAVLAKCAGN